MNEHEDQEEVEHCSTCCFRNVFAPDFYVPEDDISRRICVCCRKVKPLSNPIKFFRCSRCKCAVYCSKECQRKDYKKHKKFCLEMEQRVDEAEYMLKNCFFAEDSDFIHQASDLYAHNIFLFGADIHHASSNYYHSNNIEAVHHYMTLRDLMVDLLMQEGTNSMRKDPKGNGNVQLNILALTVALRQTYHLLALDKYDSSHGGPFSNTAPMMDHHQKKGDLLYLHLIMGEYDIGYQLSCSYAQKPERYFPFTFMEKDFQWPLQVGLNGHPVHHSSFAHEILSQYHHEEIVTNNYHLYQISAGSNEPQDVTESITKISINHESFPYTAMSFLFFYKYMLHIYMEGLIVADSFLNNQDCTAVIAEYLGLEKDWIVYEKNHYQRQACEVLYTFEHCGARDYLFRPQNVFSRYMDHFPVFKYIRTVGLKLYNDGKQSNYASLPILPSPNRRWDWNSTMIPHDSGRERDVQPCLPDPAAWVKTIMCCAAEIDRVKNEFLDPVLDFVVRKLNDIAGNNHHHQFNIDDVRNQISPVRLQVMDREAMKVIAPTFRITKFLTDIERLCDDHHINFYSFLHELDRGARCENATFLREQFTYPMAICVMMERKIAQAYFYLNQQKPDAMALLRMVYGASYELRTHPDVYESAEVYFAMHCCVGKDSDCAVEIISKARCYAREIIHAVIALSERDLATDRNLSLLFGGAALVSDILYTAKRTKLEEREEEQKTQRLISDMWDRKKTWEEGCTVLDVPSGLQLHYLTKDERKTMFGSMERSEKDDAESALSQHFREYPDGEEGRLKCVKAEFDCQSIEEALWDIAGVPRIATVGKSQNATDQLMKKAGWKKMKEGSTRTRTTKKLGDKATTKIGRRKVHTYSSEVWKETKSKKSSIGERTSDRSRGGGAGGFSALGGEEIFSEEEAQGFAVGMMLGMSGLLDDDGLMYP